jgi:hypothetical protein
MRRHGDASAVFARERRCSADPGSSGLEPFRAEFDLPREAPQNRALRGKIALFRATGDPGVEPDAAVLETVTHTPSAQRLQALMGPSDR